MISNFKLKLFILLFVRLSSDWTRYTLPTSPSFSAICNDGSPATFYLSIGEEQSWLFYLQGGGICYNQQSCIERMGQSTQNMFTSSQLRQSAFNNADGIFNRNCQINPAFCNATMVFLPYCSSDWWTGDNSIDVQQNSDNRIHFRGYNILTQTLEYILLFYHPDPSLKSQFPTDKYSKYLDKDNTPNMLKATQFVLAGYEAGSLGAMIHADRIGSLLRKYVNEPNITYRVLIDSSFVLGGDGLYRRQRCNSLNKCSFQQTAQKALQIQKNRLDEKCIKKHLPWLCMTANIILTEMETKVFILTHRVDVWQLLSDGIKNLMPSKWKVKERNHIQKRAREYEEMLQTMYERLQNIEGVYSTSCLYSVFTLFREEFLFWNGSNNTSPATAVKDWLQNANQKKKQRVFIKPNCDKINCEKGCPSLDTLSEKIMMQTPDTIFSMSGDFGEDISGLEGFDFQSTDL